MGFLKELKKIIDKSSGSLQSELLHLIPIPGVLVEVVNNTFVIVTATDQYCKLIGMNREDIIGKQVLEAFPNESQDNWKQLEQSFLKVFKTSEPDYMETLRYDLRVPLSGEIKEKYWQVQNYPINDHRNSVFYIWNTVVDITSQVILNRERDLAEEEKARWEEQEQYFIKENTDGLYSMDHSGNFINVNEGLVQIAETPEDKLLKMDFLPFCAAHDRERIVGLFKKTLDGIPQKFEGDFVSGKGRKMVLRIDLLPMRSEGEIKGVYGIAKDVTLLRTSEVNLNQKKKFLDLYSEIIDFLVTYGIETANLEYIFGKIGKTVEVDRVFYLGNSLEDLDGKIVVAESIQWSKSSPSKNLNERWLKILTENFGSFINDTPVIINSGICQSREQQEWFAHIEGGTLIIFPIFIGQDFLGILGLQNIGTSRIWMEDEKEFLVSLQKNVVSFVEKKISDLKIEKKERELLRTEIKFELLVQEGSDLVGILEADGTYKFVSASSTKILGIEPKEFIGRNAFDFIHPDDKDFIFAQFSSLTSQKQIHIPAFRFIDKNGNWRWVETTATNMITVSQVEGIVTNSRDVTEKIQHLNEIKELNTRYRLAAKATNDLVYDWNLLNDEVTRYLEGKESMFGYSLDKMKRRDFWRSHIHPEDIVGLTKQLNDVLSNPNAKEIKTQYRFRRNDGSYANIIDRGHVIRDNKGQALRLIGATNDISNIISSKNALKLANDRFNYAMKATREMVWDWNIESDIIIRSRAFKKLYGYGDTEKASVENFWFNKIIDKDREKVRNSLFAALKDPKITKWKKEYRFIRITGEKSYVIDRGYILRNAEGKAIRMVGATLDVSDSRRMIKEIKNQNKVLKEIAWEHAHVVRGPISRIKGLVQLLQLKIYKEWNSEELIDLIKDSANELDDLVINIIRKTEETLSTNENADEDDSHSKSL